MESWTLRARLLGAGTLAVIAALAALLLSTGSAADRRAAWLLAINLGVGIAGAAILRLASGRMVFLLGTMAMVQVLIAAAMLAMEIRTVLQVVAANGILAAALYADSVAFRKAAAEAVRRDAPG